MQASLEHPGQDYRFDRLRLRFRNAAVEQIFLRETLAQWINFVRSYLIAGIGLYVCFGVLDFIVGGDMLPALWAIRYGGVCPILLGIFGLTFLKSFVRFAQPALIVATLASGVGIVTMTAIMHAPFNGYYYAGLIMVVIYCGSLIRLKFVHSLWITLLLVAAYQAVGLYINPLPTEVFINNDFFLVMATGVGMFSGYIQETYVRRGLCHPEDHRGQERRHHDASEGSEPGQQVEERIPGPHEPRLRTPLNAIIGFSDTIPHEGARSEDNGQYRNTRATSIRAGSSCSSLINDVLDLAKADAGDAAGRARVDLDRRLPSLRAHVSRTGPRAERCGSCSRDCTEAVL